MRNSMGGDGSSRAPRRSGVVELNAVPKRRKAAADPSKTWVLDVRTAQVLSNTPLGELVAAICRLVANDDRVNQGVLSNGDGASSGENSVQPWSVDDIITVEEAATALHMERGRLIRQSRRFPFIRRISRKNWICSQAIMRRWLASRPNSIRGG
ncbi:MAG TPA: hypothetical protein VMM16_10820 [Verrucomicrobiae bacterium]|nr:hypothetical protein [Verrucomicrobiae bacterium]